MPPIKKLPIGIQSFETIRGLENYIYVDKTELIYRLVQTGRYYFLSRPRRFGKSLFLSTLHSLFLAKQELFSGLWIEQSDYPWTPYPVVLLDFASLSSRTPELLMEGLSRRLHEIAAHYAITIPSNLPLEEELRDLIRNLSQINKVVVLIDEYDAPLVNHIHDLELARANRAILKSFFTVIKTQEHYLRFILLTGVTQFTQVSVFSGLNNLNNLTLHNDYAALLGYTQQEISSYFAEHLDLLAKKQNKHPQDLLTEMQEWYNGYRFTQQPVTVYNPFSTLMFLEHGVFRNFWFATGTPTMLIELLKKKSYPLADAAQRLMSEEAFNSFDLDAVSPTPLLLQTGYLTIAEYMADSRQYRLDFPNKEVRTAFLSQIAMGFSQLEKDETDNSLSELRKALSLKDLDNFFKILKRFFANIPYPLHVAQERYYQTILFVIAQLTGIESQAEVMTNEGRIDLVIEMPEVRYLFEFKFEGTADQALDQIQQNRYADKYIGLTKPLILVGASFGDRGLIKEWKAAQK